MHSGNNASYLEQQNNTLVDNLSTKVSALKHVCDHSSTYIISAIQLTIQIGEDVRAQNRLLNEVVSLKLIIH